MYFILIRINNRLGIFNWSWLCLITLCFLLFSLTGPIKKSPVKRSNRKRFCKRLQLLLSLLIFKRLKITMKWSFLLTGPTNKVKECSFHTCLKFIDLAYKKIIYNCYQLFYQSKQSTWKGPSCLDSLIINDVMFSLHDVNLKCIIPGVLVIIIIFIFFHQTMVKVNEKWTSKLLVTACNQPTNKVWNKIFRYLKYFFSFAPLKSISLSTAVISVTFADEDQVKGQILALVQASYI